MINGQEAFCMRWTRTLPYPMELPIPQPAKIAVCLGKSSSIRAQAPRASISPDMVSPTVQKIGSKT
jgi:N-glycosylase/DNA lyase